MMTETKGMSQLQRMLPFLVIGLVLGGTIVYGALTPSLGQVLELNSKVNQLQQQVKQLTQVTEYKIGASMPLTGELSEIGVQWGKVLEMARDDLNSEMTKYGIKAKFTLVTLDDKGNTTEALKTFQTLAQSGIKVIIGPVRDEQVNACRILADNMKVVLITASSTLPTLAIPNDYIFRTVGSDTIQAKALATLVNTQGVKKVIVFHGDDVYSVAFADFFDKEFKTLGGSSTGIEYSSGKADYSSQVAQLSSSAKQGDVEGIVMISFDTYGVDIMGYAKEDALLSSLKWFSGEGMHGAAGLLSDSIAQFILSTDYMGTHSMFRENLIYKDFAARYKAKVGSNAPVFAASLYDAMFLAGWSMARVGSASGEAIRYVLPDVAYKYFGASGWCIFDDAGDKLYQDYSIWTVKSVDGKDQYVDIGGYFEGSITWG